MPVDDKAPCIRYSSGHANRHFTYAEHMNVLQHYYIFYKNNVVTIVAVRYNIYFTVRSKP